MTQMYINSILLSLSLIGLVLIGNVRAAPSEQLQVVLKYHMGPVLSNNKTVHLIWYGSWSSGEKRIIRAFISSLSASEPLAVGGAVVESSRKLHGPNWFESFCRSICGFHYFTFRSIVGYTLPFAWVGNSEKMCPSLCAFPFVVPEYMHGVKALKPPIGQPSVDDMISVIGHELTELTTNFLRNGWYAGDDPNFQTEVGDLCEGLYGRGGGGAYVGEIQTDAT
ncbi:putative protein EXORDIUM [Helianthus annuus]|nr:putative protein EXORDIUM [Helianthus annuus]